nr:MAG TPA: hypothetical protein [Caudoviricetes sp.]
MESIRKKKKKRGYQPLFFSKCVFSTNTQSEMIKPHDMGHHKPYLGMDKM